MKIGFICKYDLSSNPQLTERFKFKECTFTRRISSKSDKVYSKGFYPLDYSEIVENAQMMKEHTALLLAILQVINANICNTMNNLALILCEMLPDEGGMNP